MRGRLNQGRRAVLPTTSCMVQIHVEYCLVDGLGHKVIVRFEVSRKTQYHTSNCPSEKNSHKTELYVVSLQSGLRLKRNNHPTRFCCPSTALISEVPLRTCSICKKEKLLHRSEHRPTCSDRCEKIKLQRQAIARIGVKHEHYYGDRGLRRFDTVSRVPSG